MNQKIQLHVIIKSQEITESEFVTEKLRNTAQSSSVLAAGKVHTFQAFFLRNPRPNSTLLLLLTVEDSSMLLTDATRKRRRRPHKLYTVDLDSEILFK